MKNRRLSIVWRQFRQDKGMWLSAFFLFLIIAASIIIGFCNVDPDKINVSNMLGAPSPAHWFGTDELGRDYFVRVLYGARVSLLVGILAMVTSVVLGVVIGMTAGYFGGIVDNILMRITDVFSAVPWIIMVTVVSLLFRKGLFSIIFVIGLFSWMEVARLVRAETMSAKEREFVQYAKLIGVSKGKIMSGHILPIISPVIITAATAAIANAIMVESAMSFLGIGVQAPMASWGSLLQTAQANLAKAPHMAFIPGLLIVLTICSFNKLGDLLRLYVEPRIMQEDV